MPLPPPTAACPHLPTWTTTGLSPRPNGRNLPRDASFYLQHLRQAQWYWLRKKPAQAILAINKAWTAQLTHADHLAPQPFRALSWIFRRAGDGQAGFIGNPVRHFQHLASRVSGPQAPARKWRAWACFHLAERHLNPASHPRDGHQIAREGLWIPSLNRVLHELRTHGWSSDAADLTAALKEPHESIEH